MSRSNEAERFYAQLGNAAAMRAALEKINRLVWDKRRHTKEETEAHRLATEALFAPPRNCDVGTAVEQSKRMEIYCKAHGTDESGCYRCESCTFLRTDRCELAWAQLPYEAKKGGAE